MLVQHRLWLGIILVVFAFAATPVVAQDNSVFLPYIYDQADMGTLPVDPVEAVVEPTMEETSLADGDMPETSLPSTPEVSPESRAQDTDGYWAMAQVASIESPQAFSAPGNWTIGGSLGVGTETPAFKGDIIFNTNGVNRLRVQNTSTGTDAWADVAISTGNGNGYAIQKFGANFSTFVWNGQSLANWARFRSDSGVAGLIFTTGGPSPLVFGTLDVERMRITSDGLVGIGTKTPRNDHRVSIVGGGVFNHGIYISNANMAIQVDAASWGVYIQNAGDDGIYVNRAEDDGIQVNSVGDDGFYVYNPGGNGLQVDYASYTGKDGVLVNNGDIVINGGAFVDTGQTLSVPDYVFEDDYPLMPLEELREFVRTNRHLPNVQSEAEIMAQGVNLSQFSMRLLEKIEELTLYTLEQDSRISAQNAEISSLERANGLLEARLAMIERMLGANRLK